MSFIRLMCKATNLERRKIVLEEEKIYAHTHQAEIVKLSLKQRCRHRCLDFTKRIKKSFKKCFTSPKKTLAYRFFYRLRHDGSCENYVLKSIIGFIGGFLLTYLFFMFFVFQLNFKFSTATIMCSIFGCILTIGLAFSYRVRCIVFLTLPQLFSKRGRQALLAYAFILAITGPAKNTLNNMGILSESLACGQEQLKEAVKQILDVIKKPFYAIRDAIRTVIKVLKIVVKKIKEILLAIKRVIVAIIKVIKAVFQFLAKIVNICNKELGTPFQRCIRVFESAITDCQAKLGPTFSWLCSVTYLAQSVCYLVKFLDFVCSLIEFISNNVVGVVVKKIKNFIRHIKTMFYVRIKFSHSFHFETNASKSLEDVATGIVTEIKERTEGLMNVFDFMSCATSLFFIFIVFRVLHYRYKFLTDERFDNIFINKDFKIIDIRRAQLGKETVLPLNQRERNVYVSVSSLRLVKKEKLKLSQSAVVLGMATLKLATHMMADYALFWVLTLIRKHASFQSTFEGSKIPTVHVKGKGLFADLLRSIVKAFQPVGVRLEIDTVPCLPDPISPDYDRYIQIASLLATCWLLMIFEPYGLRWRHSVMCFYHPTRARQRAIWLYNQILRTRSSFLKFARRQLRRKFRKDHTITNITYKEYLAANLTARFKILRMCIKPGKQLTCLLCGEVFRDEDAIKPIKCQTPGCPGVYCEQCFQDLQNLCTICLDPIQYGDLSDVSEERDSSADEASQSAKSMMEHKQKCKWCKNICGKNKEDSDNTDQGDEYDRTGDTISDLTTRYTSKGTDSDYYSTDIDADSFEYQYKKDVTLKAIEPLKRPFVDVEKQHLPDYASMKSFQEDQMNYRPSDLFTKATTLDSEETMLSLSGTLIHKVPQKKGSLLRKINQFKSKNKKHEEISLLSLDSTDDNEEEEEDQIGTSTETTYVGSTENSKIKQSTKRFRWYKRNRATTSSDTTYIETPKTSKRKYDMKSNIPVDEETPVKKSRKQKKKLHFKSTNTEPSVPDEIPKLDLDFDTCICGSPSCTGRSCVCKVLDKKVKYHTETETSSRNHSVRSITFLSPSVSNRTETSPISETTTSTSMHSSQTENSGPHDTINYLYDMENNPRFIDQHKHQPQIVRRRQPVKEDFSSTTVSGVHVQSFKRKVDEYYKKVGSDYKTVKIGKDQSKFKKFFNRLLQTDNFDRSSTRPRLTKSFLSESDSSGSTTALTEEGKSKFQAPTNVLLSTTISSNSLCQTNNISKFIIDAFYYIFMGGRSSTQKGIDEEESRYKETELRASEESFQIIADKFGYYDSTDSEISELQLAVTYNKRQSEDIILPSFDKIDDSESDVDNEEVLEEEEKEEEEFKEEDFELPNIKDSGSQDSKEKLSNEDTSSQMSIERNRSSFDRQSSTRYSREPPEKDHNYDDNLKKYYCHCRNPGDCKIEKIEESSSCCPRVNKKNICRSQNQICPPARTTYDLVKSAENLRQRDFNRTNSYNNPPKHGSHSRSSPEVSKNQAQRKAVEMLTNDNPDYMYNDYISGTDHMKNHYLPKYPYEEPLNNDEYNQGNHTKDCICPTCSGRIQRRTHYRNCKCCECARTKRPVEDQMSCCSEESQGLNLAYQKTAEYPVLVDEIENTISQRNKERVRKTMRQFELLSRQNKGLDKPIYDDDEDECNANRYSCNKRSPPFNRPRSNEANSSFCYERDYQTRSDCLSDKPGYTPTPFPRSKGYVEKVARYMDPIMSDNTQKYSKYESEFANSKWQMDPRSGEWVKVYDDNYDFENNYPPLPSAPSPMYNHYDNYAVNVNQPCKKYYPPSHRSASPMQRNKPCNCRNCMASQSSSRY